jgi:8-oxo-dGTP pyrophosphatase MutT (NUDIX family)
MFNSFIERFQKRLQFDLPGEESQFLMAPYRRTRLKDLDPAKISPRPSAVMILIFPVDELAHTVLIQRPVYDGVHSGQVAFPGGKHDPEDHELVNTALRETREEIGIQEDKINILGKLTDLYINPSNFLVSPFVGYMNTSPDFEINKREVSKIITINLETLRQDSIKGIKTITHSDGTKLKTPYYNVEGLTVWGATAMIISELNTIINELRTIS